MYYVTHYHETREILWHQTSWQIYDWFCPLQALPQIHKRLQRPSRLWCKNLLRYSGTTSSSGSRIETVIAIVLTQGTNIKIQDKN